MRIPVYRYAGNDLPRYHLPLLVRIARSSTRAGRRLVDSNRLDARDHDAAVLGSAARHDRVDRDALDGGATRSTAPARGGDRPSTRPACAGHGQPVVTLRAKSFARIVRPSHEIMT